MSEGMTKQELEANVATYEHLEHVRRLLRVFANELLRRGESHDRSKLGEFERKTFAEFTPKLKGMTYGSEEYKACLAAMKPALDHHYANNRHHPEYFHRGVDDMNLVDLVEMFIDWAASTLRHADGDIHRSISVNKARFGLSEQVESIFRNTATCVQGGHFGDNSGGEHD